MPRFVKSLSLVSCLTLALALLASSALAGSVTASLSRTEGGIGDLFLLTLSIEGDRTSDPEIPEIPGLVIQQQGYSESTITNNGQPTVELSLTYAIRAQRTGEFTIPSISVEVDGQKESSLPLTLKVRSDGQSPPDRGQQDPTNQGSTSAGSGAKGQDTGGVFIERECNQSSVYVGEQLTCAVRIYHRGNLNGGQRKNQNSTEFRRFMVEGERHYQKVINGQRYAVIELQEVIVPLREGPFTLPPFTLEARVLTWNRRANPLDKFFDRFGGGMLNFDLSFTEEKEVTVTSQPTELTVKPLPTQGRPAGFYGLVGSFELSAAATPTELPQGETVTVTVTLSGSGVLDTATGPANAWAALGKVYADKPGYKETVSGDQGIQSSKTFKYALVPAKPGTFALGAAEVPIFDPRLEKYVALRAELGQVIVLPSQAEEKPVAVGGSASPAAKGQDEVKVLDQEALGLHRDVDLTAAHALTRLEAWTLALLGASSLSLPAFLLGFTAWRHRHQTGGAADQRRRRAQRSFQAALEKAQAQLGQGQPQEGLHLAFVAFRAYLGDQLDIQGTALTAREIDQTLGRLGAGAALRQRAAEVIGRLEKVEFGGLVPPPEMAPRLLQELREIVEELEK